MSLVIAAISKDNDIVVCGDGRALDVKTDEIVSENTRKVIKINSLLIIGYAGYMDKYKSLAKHLIEVFPERNKWNVTDISKEALKYEQEHFNEEGDLQFLVAGYEYNATPHLYVINVGAYGPHRFDFVKQRTVSLGDELCKLRFDKENDQLFDIENKIENLIKDRAKINPAINDKVISERLFSF